MENYHERPSSPGVEKIMLDFYASDDDSVSASVASKRRRHPLTRLIGKKDVFPVIARKDQTAEKINDKHFAADMIRRTVFNDRTEVDRPHNVSTIENEISNRTSQRQMKGLQHTQSMQNIIHQVMVVHNTVTGYHYSRETTLF